MLIINYY